MCRGQTPPGALTNQMRQGLNVLKENSSVVSHFGGLAINASACMLYYPVNSN